MRNRSNRRVSRRAGGARTGGRSTWNMLVWNHLKLWVATGAGVLTVLALPARWSLISRLLTGWNIAIAVLLPLTWLLLRRLDSGQLRRRYEEEDPTAPVIIVVVIAAAFISILAIVALLSTLRHVPADVRAAHLLLATLTILDSWLLVHMMFTIHYADLYYSVPADRQPPLRFPDTPEPLFWDFVYFAFTIGVACQTADVSTTRTDVRRTVTVHSLIAFVFNLFILGFAINVSAGLLGGG